MENHTIKEGKNAALISYIPVIGAPIAFFLIRISEIILLVFILDRRLV